MMIIMMKLDISWYSMVYCVELCYIVMNSLLRYTVIIITVNLENHHSVLKQVNIMVNIMLINMM